MNSATERPTFWGKFCRNPVALASLIFLAFSAFVALFAYALAPDHTPNANQQSVDIALQPPGFRVLQLAVRNRQTLPKQSWLARLWGGAPAAYKHFSIQQFFFSKDSIFIEKWAGLDEQSQQLFHGDTIAFHVAQVLYAASPTQPTISKTIDQKFHYFDLQNQPQTTEPLDVLQEKIRKTHLASRTFWLGTDVFGRCMLSRLVVGIRISLLVGLISVAISLFVGVALGALAGYFGGRTDDIIMLIINVVWSIPTLLLVFAIVMAVGRSATNIYIAVGLTMWVDVARLVRGQVAALRHVQFVEAAQSLGFGNRRILFRHILPNILAAVSVVAAANFATAILVEAGLSYLGFGIQPPQPSWGTLLNENYGYALSGKPALALVPALAIMLLVLAFNLLGNGIRDALDVRN